MPVYGLWRHTWREQITTLASQGQDYEEFQEEAKKRIPKEYKEVILHLPVIYMEVKYEKNLIEKRNR